MKDATFFLKYFFGVDQKRVRINFFFLNAGFSQPIPKPCQNIAAISFLASRRMSKVNIVCFFYPTNSETAGLVP